MKTDVQFTARELCVRLEPENDAEKILLQHLEYRDATVIPAQKAADATGGGEVGLEVYIRFPN